MGVDQGQEGSKLDLIVIRSIGLFSRISGCDFGTDLSVILDSVQLSDALLQLTLQHQSHAIEKLKCRIATENNWEGDR